MVDMSSGEVQPDLQQKKMIPYWWKVVFAFTLGWMFISQQVFFESDIRSYRLRI